MKCLHTELLASILVNAINTNFSVNGVLASCFNFFIIIIIIHKDLHGTCQKLKSIKTSMC